MTPIGSGSPAARPELDISLEKICYVIAKARELDVKVAPEELGRCLGRGYDAAYPRGLRGRSHPRGAAEFLLDQNDDELRELLALAWLGRGDFTIAQWQDGLGQVRDVRRYHTADYLLGTPLLVDFLEEGLAQFGLSCEEFELGRM